jgi:hypothetical protein
MENTVVIHVHGSSSAALTDFFTSSGPFAILSIISDKYRLMHAWHISNELISRHGNCDVAAGAQRMTTVALRVLRTYLPASGIEISLGMDESSRAEATMTFILPI